MSGKRGKTFQIKDNDIFDGYHTFDELYDHRCLLFIVYLLLKNPFGCFWIREHFPGWDLLVIESDTVGQISYHVPVKFRPLYENALAERGAKDYKYDGHTSQDVITRLIQLCLNLQPISSRQP